MLPHLPHAQWVVTTLGSRGAVLLQRQLAGEGYDVSGKAAVLDEVINQLMQQAKSSTHGGNSQAEAACTSANGIAIGYEPMLLTRHCVLPFVKSSHAYC